MRANIVYLAKCFYLASSSLSQFGTVTCCVSDRLQMMCWRGAVLTSLTVMSASH